MKRGDNKFTDFLLDGGNEVRCRETADLAVKIFRVYKKRNNYVCMGREMNREKKCFMF